MKTKVKVNTTEIVILLVLWIFLIWGKSKNKLLWWISQYCVKLISTFKSPYQKFLLTEVLLTKFYWRQAELVCSRWSSMLSDQSCVVEAFHFSAHRDTVGNNKPKYNSLHDLGSNANTYNETDYWNTHLWLFIKNEGGLLIAFKKKKNCTLSASF